MYGTDSRDAFPAYMLPADVLARKVGTAIDGTNLKEQLERLGVAGIKLLPEDIRETLELGARETWVIPSRVAEALRGIADRAAKEGMGGPIDRLAQGTLGLWKRYKLFAPQSHVRYEFNNTIANQIRPVFVPTHGATIPPYRLRPRPQHPQECPPRPAPAGGRRTFAVQGH